MKYPWLYKGNKVICIDDNWGTDIKLYTYYITFPEYRKIYSIRDIKIYNNNKIGLMFNEILNPQDMLLNIDNENCTIGEVSFDVEQFKPLEKKSLNEDISMFNKLTNKSLDKVY